MDDPAWSWPAWKFGFKRDDIFTTLQEQYNTVSFSIQDPEAFHHDVFEISHDAETVDDFHRMMEERRKQRRRELNESLESMAVEIIANPKLMRTDQWQHAIHLFQSKSFDSIVRFFASYLPEDYLDCRSQSSAPSSDFESDSHDTRSTIFSSDDEALYEDYDEEERLYEKTGLSTETERRHEDIHENHLVGEASPMPSSESDHLLTEASSSPTDTTDSQSLASTRSPSRSMSFSDTASTFDAGILRSYVKQDDETSQSDDCDTAATSVSDCTEARSLPDSIDDDADKDYTSFRTVEDDDEFPCAQYPEDGLDNLDIYMSNDVLDSDTPTPRQETAASNYVDFKSMLSGRLSSSLRSLSPKPHSPHAVSCGEITHTRSIRRSPEESRNKIQKPMSCPLRRGPKCRT